MKTFLLRVWRSPRLGWVALAVCAPTLVTVAFAPVWAVALAAVALLASIAFMYAVVLSPKYIHSADTVHPAQFYKETVTHLGQAQSDIREAVELASVSALDLGHRLQNLQVNHDAQMQLAKQVLAQNVAAGPDEASLTDLSLQASQLLKKHNARFKGIVENSIAMIKQLQINSIDAGHPEDVPELQGLVTTLRKALQEASDEVQVMNQRLSGKLDESAQTLVALDELTEDTRTQVRDALTAMQYHDITTKKLAEVERVHLASLHGKALEKLSLLKPGETFKQGPETSSPLARLAGQNRPQDGSASVALAGHSDHASARAIDAFQ